VPPRGPYCSNCGYSLVGLTESSKCPECGKPLVEVLVRSPADLPRGRRYRSPIAIFGLPLVHVATGPADGQTYGRARGIIAVGDFATGLVAIGNAFAAGIIAIGGGCAVGVVALGGGLAFGLVSLAGLAVGGLALGGGAVGGIAQGGAACGYIAIGGGAYGYYAAGGAVNGTHVLGPRTRDPAAVARFNDLRWLLGPWPPHGVPVQFLAWMFAGTVAVATITALVIYAGYLSTAKRGPPAG
jgi:hypothetical protein